MLGLDVSNHDMLATEHVGHLTRLFPRYTFSDIFLEFEHTVTNQCSRVDDGWTSRPSRPHSSATYEQDTGYDHPRHISFRKRSLQSFADGRSGLFHVYHATSMQTNLKHDDLCRVPCKSGGTRTQGLGPKDSFITTQSSSSNMQTTSIKSRTLCLLQHTVLNLTTSPSST